MRLPSWQQMIGRFWRRSAEAPSHRRRRNDFTRLSLRRLEDRRVLNGAPVGMGVTISDAQGALVVDATQDGGASQKFTVSLESKNGMIDLELTSNGTILYEQEVDKIASVTFRASGSNDSLVVDFANGDPIPVGGITFIAAGPALPGGVGDSLQFVNGSVNAVAYSLSSPTDGQVNITVGAQNSAVRFSGAGESVTDLLGAQARSFSIGSAIAQAQLAPDAQGAGLSQMGISGGTFVDFVNPTGSLAVNGDPQALTSFDIHGLGAGFNAGLSIAAGPGSTVNFSADTNLGGGGLSVSAGDIEIAAMVATNHGTIELNASQQIVVSTTGSLATTASAISLAAPTITQQGIISSAEGGTVRLDAGPAGTLVDSGIIDASSSVAGQTGGSVDLLGKYVGLTGSAVVNVSGDAGGGLVRIGGDFHGANAAVEDAARTYVGQNVMINADAQTSGNGGRVVVWSNEATAFYGQIEARGGAIAGNGGYVEVSSLQSLAEMGTVDLSAAHGQIGALLLDPKTIEIADAASAPNDGSLPVILFTDSPSSNFVISNTALEASLADIILQARNSITVDNLTSNGGVLLLQPDVNITMQTRNDTTSGDSATGGIMFVNSANVIETQGAGSITIEAGVNANSSGVVSSHQGTADVSVGGLTTAGGAVTVVASRNMTLLSDVVSSGGTITLTADSTNSGTGTLEIDGNVNTSGGPLTATSADIKLSGTINAGTAGIVTLQTTAGHTIGLGNGLATDYTLDTTELSHIFTQNLIIGGPNAGDIFVNADSGNMALNVGLVTLLATDGDHSVTVTGSSVASTAGFNALSVSANNGIIFDASLHTLQGDLTLDGDADNTAAAGPPTSTSDKITFADGVTLDSAGAMSLKATTGGMIGAGALTLNAVNGITLVSDLTTAGTTIINADSDGDGIGTLEIDGALNTSGGTLTATSADIVLAGSINVGTSGTATLQTTAGHTIGLGDNVVTDYKLDKTELSKISALNLVIGGPNGGDIFVDANSGDMALGVGHVTLLATDGDHSVTFSGSSASSTAGFNALSVSANDGIIVNTGIRTLQGDLSLNGDADNAPAAVTTSTSDAITFADGVTLDSAGAMTLKATTGGMTGAGTLTLNAVNGITLASDLTTVGMTVFNADSDGNGIGTLEIDGNVNTSGGPLTATSADITLPGTINAGTAGIVTLQTTAGHTIGLGNGLATDYTLDTTELSHIFAQNLIIGGPNAGDIFVNADSGNMALNVGLVTLLATDGDHSVTVTGSSVASTAGFNALSVSANNGIIFDASLRTLQGDLTLDGDADNTAAAGPPTSTSDKITFADGVTLDSAGAMSLKATTGGMVGAGALTLNAVNGITLVSDLTTAGTTIINADSDGDGIGTLEIDGALNSSGGALTATSADIVLAGSINVGTSGTATLQTTAGHTIGLGDNVVTDYKLDKTELSKISALNLVIGGPNGGDIFVDANSGDMALGVGHVTLLATDGDHSVTFSGSSASSTAGFNALSVSANDGIIVNTGIRTLQGDLSLNGDADNAPAAVTTSTSDAITFADGVTLDSAGAMTLKATTGGMTGAGTLTLNAVNGITLASDLTTAGVTIINADSNADGLGTLEIDGTLNTSGGALTATAADIKLPGTINTGTSGVVTLLTTAGRTIGLGDGVVADYRLDGTELSHIFAIRLVIGGPGNGSIVVGSVTGAQSANIGTVELHAETKPGSTLLFSGPTTFNALTGFADTDITVNASITAVQGDIDLESNATFTVNAEITTLPSDGGGTYIQIGNVVFTPSGSAVTGTGKTIKLVANGNLDIIVTRDVPLADRVSATTIDLEARRDVIVDAPLVTTTSSANIILIADRNHIGVGGVWITPTGSLDSAGNVTIEGSLLHGLEVPGFTGPVASVRVDANGVNPLANQITAAGNISIASGPGAPASPDANVILNGGVASTGAGTIDVTAKNQIQIDTTISSAGGAITFHSPVVLTGPVAVTSNALASAGGNIEFVSTVDSAASEANPLTLSAGLGAVSFLGAVGSGVNQALGAFLVSSSGSFLESLGVIAASFEVNSAGNIELDGSVTSTGPFTAHADTDANGTGTVTLAPGVVVKTNDHALHITAANFIMQGSGGTLASLNSGTATTTIEASDCETIGLGSALGSNITITEAELKNMFSGALTIGGLMTGTITADNVTTDGQQGPVTLIAGCDGAQIVFSGGASSFAILMANANDGMLVQQSVTTTVGDLVLNGDADAPDAGDTHENIVFSPGVTLNAKGNLTIEAAGGNMQFSGALTLDAMNGSVTVVNDLKETAGGSSLAINAGNNVLLEGNVTTTGTFTANAEVIPGTGTFTIAASKSVTTNGNALNISAHDVQLPGSLNSGAATTTIQAAHGETVGLGNVIGSPMTLDNTELSHISSGALVIGGALTSTITADGVVTTAGQGPVTLNAGLDGAQIVFSGNASSFAALTANANDGMLVQKSVTTTAGDLVLNGDADAPDAGDTHEDIVFSPGVTLNAEGNLTIEAAGGNMQFSGALTLDAMNGSVTVVNDLKETAGGSTLTINAGKHILLEGDVTTTGTFTANAEVIPGTGTFTIAASKSLTTSGNALNISAADVQLFGSLDSGAATTTIQAAHGETVGLGSAVGSTMTLDNGELSRINSGALVIGGGLTSTITADGVLTTATQGPVTLNAGLDGAQIVFSGSASSFASLTANANDGMLEQQNVTTTIGDLVLDGDHDAPDPGDTHENIVFSAGVTLNAKGNLTIEAAGGNMQYGGSLTLDAGGDVRILNNLTATGSPSPLVVDAGGMIIQANGTTLDAGSGTINFHAGSDITLAHVTTTNTSSVPVLMTSTLGGIINGLAPVTGENITALAAELEAVTGIGSAAALQTAVNTLAAVNTTSGNIQIVNNVGGPLAIGTVGTTVGLTNTGGGSMNVSNTGLLTVLNDVLDIGGGDIALTTTNSGDLVTSAHVRATGASGNIVLNAGHDLIVNAQGTGADILTQGNGLITGVAQHVVTFNGAILVQTGVGAITELSPGLANVFVPQITAQGLAVLTGTFSEPPPANNFTVVVDWHDGTTSTQVFLGVSSSSFQFTHVYTRNPDTADQAQPIPITVTVFDDPHSSFTGLQQPPIVIPLNPTDTKTIVNGATSVTTQSTIPGEGLNFFINIAQIAIVIPQLNLTPPNMLVFTPVAVVPQVAQTEAAEETQHVFEETAVEERQVILKVLDPTGKVTDTVVMDESVLDDLPGLFKKLPDGHYQIFLKEPGEEGERLLLDVMLRGGKPSDESEGGQDKPPTAEEAPLEEMGALERGLPQDGEGELSLAMQLTPLGVISMPEASCAAGFASFVVALPADPVVVPVAAGEYSAHGDSAAGNSAADRSTKQTPAIVAAGALTATVVGQEWAERVDRALAQTKSDTLSKAARLSRRLRRPAARDSISGARKC